MNERVRLFMINTIKAMIKEHREESYVREYTFNAYEKNRITDDDFAKLSDMIDKEYAPQPIVDELPKAEGGEDDSFFEA